MYHVKVYYVVILYSKTHVTSTTLILLSSDHSCIIYIHFVDILTHCGHIAPAAATILLFFIVSQ